MNKKLLTVVLLLAPSLCATETNHLISLEGANFSLALPVMNATADGTLYVAFRSFDWLKRSNKLVVLAYDLRSHHEVRRRSLSVPTVHGPRVANGLYLSKDGQLAYAEVHDPCLILLISTQDLSEIRRSNTPIFIARDRQGMFAGFDNNGLLSFASDSPEGLRFARFDTASLHVVSDTTATAVHQERSQPIVWSPSARRTWTFKPSSLGADEWLEYTEEGQATGEKFSSSRGTPNGALALGQASALAFFGTFAEGMLINYSRHRSTDLKLQCSPHLYGRSEDLTYVGAICVTNLDREPERGGDKILSSEFSLLGTESLRTVWRHTMSFVDLAEKGRDDVWFHQDGNPAIAHSGKRAWVVAPSDAQVLDIFEIGMPE